VSYGVSLGCGMYQAGIYLRSAAAAKPIRLQSKERDMTTKRIRPARFALAAAGVCMMMLTGRIALAQHFKNGHSLLGAKLSQDGKHEIDKIGNNAVTADVNNKKVVNMSAGNLSARKVKLRPSRFSPFPYVPYGYCFGVGSDEYCYWYPPSDVVVNDTWIEYSR
jgi:hypothetical protein